VFSVGLTTYSISEEVVLQGFWRRAPWKLLELGSQDEQNSGKLSGLLQPIKKVVVFVLRVEKTR
jgi:hypothetical protein